MSKINIKKQHEKINIIWCYLHLDNGRNRIYKNQFQKLYKIKQTKNMINFSGNQTQLTQQVFQILESLKFTTIQNIQKHNPQLIYKIKHPDSFKTLIDIVSQNDSKELTFSALTLLNNYEREHFFSSELFYYATSKIIEKPIYFEDHPIRKAYKSFVQKLCCWKSILEWNPAETIKINCENSEKLKPTLDCLLGMASAFQYRLEPDSLSWMQNLNKKILSILLEKMLQNCVNDPEILYLGFKYFQKISHCTLPKYILEAVTYLIQIVKAIINAKQDYPLEQYSEKNTNGFYFFHTKKWVYKLLMSIFKKSASIYSKIKLNFEENSIFKDAREWMQKYGKTINDLMINDLKASYPPQVSCQLLRCIQRVQTNHPDLVFEYRNTLQYEILLPIMVISAEDEEKMKNNPFQYSKELDNLFISHRNVKRICEDIWVGFLKKPFLSGYEEILNFFSQLLQSQNPIQIQLAFRLMSRSPQQISMKIFQLKLEIIISAMKCQIFVLRAAAFEYISSFIQCQFVSQNVLIKLIQILYESLTKDTYIYARLKASEALLKISKKAEIHDLIKPIIYECCLICLKLSEEFWVEHLIIELKNLFKVFYNELTPLAPELFKQAERVFIELLNSSKSKEIPEEMENIDNQFTLETLLEFQKDLVSMMPSNKLSMVENTIYTYESELVKQGVNHEMQMGTFFQLIGSFLEKSETISDRLWIYFDVFVGNKNVKKNNSPEPEKPEQAIKSYLIHSYLNIEDYISCFSSFFMFLHQLPHNLYLQKLESLLTFIKNYNALEFDNPRIIFVICGSIIENVVWSSVQMRNRFINEIINTIHRNKHKKHQIYQYISTSLLTFYPEIVTLIHKKNNSVYQKLISSIRVGLVNIVFPKLYVLGCLNLFLLKSTPVDKHTLQTIIRNVLKLMKKQNLNETLMDEFSDEQNNDKQYGDEMQMQFEDDIYLFTDYPLCHRSYQLDEKIQFIKTMEELKKSNPQLYLKTFQCEEVEEIMGNIKENNPFLMEFNGLSVHEGANPT